MRQFGSTIECHAFAKDITNKKRRDGYVDADPAVYAVFDPHGYHVTLRHNPDVMFCVPNQPQAGVCVFLQEVRL